MLELSLSISFEKCLSYKCLYHACCSSRWSMSACGTGSASPRNSWEPWPSSGSGTIKSCWSEPWSPCRTRDMPTRRSWSSTETTSTSRTSARISGRRLVCGVPSSHQELSQSSLYEMVLFMFSIKLQFCASEPYLIPAGSGSITLILYLFSVLLF